MAGRAMSGRVGVRYDHAQRGTTILVIGGLALGIAGLVSFQAIAGAGRQGTPPMLPLALVLLIVGASLAVFTRLRVVVDASDIRWAFGPGFPRFSLSLAEVVSAKAVTSSRWLGYGIRIIPRGMLYNVSGTGGVEILRRDNRVVRLGTDEPEALLAAILAAIADAQPTP